VGKVDRLSHKSSLTSEADQRDLVIAAKTMRAALRLRKFETWNAEVLHDEGNVLGVNPASQSDNDELSPEKSKEAFESSGQKVKAILDLVSASGELGSLNMIAASDTARYRPGTAFIIMAMDKSKPELTDVADAVKEVFARFGVQAVRADDIEHEGLITKRILTEIETAEFCFADLTGERPNVYYEVGYAHALNRRVILYRKEGTAIHFDLAAYNCPSYENLKHLKEQLTKRLEYIINQKPR
jgi:hypothetical protein